MAAAWGWWDSCSAALFSGAETGFYRATRLRLVLDAMGGDAVARGLLFLTNHPSLFVATTLVGNSLATYLVSLAMVVVLRAVIPGPGTLVPWIAPLVAAPVLLVYGELLPKNLFLQAPNRLLRRFGPVFLVFVVLLLPLARGCGAPAGCWPACCGSRPSRSARSLPAASFAACWKRGTRPASCTRPSAAWPSGIFAAAGRPVVRSSSSPSASCPAPGRHEQAGGLRAGRALPGGGDSRRIGRVRRAASSATSASSTWR